MLNPRHHVLSSLSTSGCLVKKSHHCDKGKGSLSHRSTVGHTAEHPGQSERWTLAADMGSITLTGKHICAPLKPVDITECWFNPFAFYQLLLNATLPALKPSENEVCELASRAQVGPLLTPSPQKDAEYLSLLPSVCATMTRTEGGSHVSSIYQALPATTWVTICMISASC